MKKILMPLILITTNSIVMGQLNVNYNIKPESGKTQISKHIYGFNFSSGKLDFEQGHGFSFTRMGGNRSTAYNWENNASNAGSDYGPNVSDGWWISAVGAPQSEKNKPAAVASTVFEKAKKKDAQALITLQMAGYVSADNNGIVKESAPNSRWCESVLKKGSPFSLTPDLSDGKVYMDEYVNFLVNKYGKASEGGILAYGMDNEPDLWSHTHKLIHPDKLTCVELIQKTTIMAKAVKTIDPSAKIFGFVSYGFNGYNNLQGAPDWEKEKGSYSWFIDYFLDKLKKESETAGNRLVDVLSLHWYPEAKGDNRIIMNEAKSEKDKLARLQAPRTLWDNEYLEDSWIADYSSSFLPLLPRIKKSIDKYNPGTEIAFTEFQYGGYEDITGTIALTDVLGIFGKFGVYAATHWGTPGSYGALAYKIFRNYDDKYAVYGDVNVEASMSDKVNSSIYASVSSSTDKFHIVALNKSMKQSINGTFTIVDEKEDYKTASVYAISEGTASIEKKSDITISNNKFTYTLPALSVCHFILKRSNISNDNNSVHKSTYNAVHSFSLHSQSAILKLSIEKASRVSITMYNTKGQLEMSKDMGIINAGNREVKLNFLPVSGMHLLNVKIGDDHKNMKFVLR